MSNSVEPIEKEEVQLPLNAFVFSPKSNEVRSYRPPMLERPTKHHPCKDFPVHALPVLAPGSNLPADYQLSPLYKTTSNTSYLTQCFEKLSLLGEGSYGIVYKGLSKDDGEWYAIKKAKERFRNMHHRKMKLHEVHRYQKIPQNDYCVKFIRSWEEDGYLFIQMELCSSTLDQYVRRHEISEDILWKMLQNLLMGLQHLHMHDFIHLDVKPDNILLSSGGTFKLGDFGMILDLSKGPVDGQDEGDARYLAPEVLQGLFTKSADIFSLGISMFEVAAKIDLPSSGPLWHHLRTGVLPSQLLQDVSRDFIDVIQSMMSPAHKKRPVADQLLRHDRLQKRQKGGCVQVLASGMVSAIKSWYDMGRAAVLNCGVGIYRSLAFARSVDNNHCCIEDNRNGTTATPVTQDMLEPPFEQSAYIRGRGMFSGTPVMGSLKRGRALTCRKRIFHDDKDVDEDDDDDDLGKDSVKDVGTAVANDSTQKRSSTLLENHLFENLSSPSPGPSGQVRIFHKESAPERKNTDCPTPRKRKRPLLF